MGSVILGHCADLHLDVGSLPDGRWPRYRSVMGYKTKQESNLRKTGIEKKTAYNPQHSTCRPRRQTVPDEICQASGRICPATMKAMAKTPLPPTAQ